MRDAVYGMRSVWFHMEVCFHSLMRGTWQYNTNTDSKGKPQQVYVSVCVCVWGGGGWISPKTDSEKYLCRMSHTVYGILSLYFIYISTRYAACVMWHADTTCPILSLTLAHQANEKVDTCSPRKWKKWTLAHQANEKVDTCSPRKF